MNRDELLREMGLTPIWQLRRPPPVVADAVVPLAEGAAGAELPVGANPDTPPQSFLDTEATPADDVVSAPIDAPGESVPLDGAESGFFEPGGGDQLPSPDSGGTAEFAFEPPDAVPPAVIVPPVSGIRPTIGVGPERQGRIAALDWASLAEATAECRACGLCRQRKQAVFGVGDPQPDWLFIGEGPGEQEDLRGEPFVGMAGQLLDAMLGAIALRRGDKVYIANAVKCRPPGNRTPSPEEIAACRPFLNRQIALMRPKLIVLLGRAAVSSVLDIDTSLAGLRGRVHQFGDIPVVVTYHPAYLLRTLPEKAKAWEDLCLARRVMRERSGVRV